MLAWEYRTVIVGVLDIGDALKNREKRAALDPEITDREFMENTFKDGRQDLGWLMNMQVLVGYSTSIKKGLALLGAEGWEMVGVSPTMKLWSGGQKFDAYYSDFLLFFKRPYEV